jgi:hypothetical protein
VEVLTSLLTGPESKYGTYFHKDVHERIFDHPWIYLSSLRRFTRALGPAILATLKDRLALQPTVPRQKPTKKDRS